MKREVTTPLLYLFILGDTLGAGVYVLVGQVTANDELEKDVRSTRRAEEGSQPRSWVPQDNR